MSLRRDIEDYLLFCELTKQYSPNTVRNYRNTLERLVTFLESKRITHTKAIDMDVVNAYRLYLSKQTTLRGEPMSLKAQAYQIVVLRSFLKFMVKNGSLVLNPDSLELPKTRMRRIEFLNDTEVIKLSDGIINDPSKVPEVQKKRNQAIILTIFGSGLRLTELLSIKKNEIIEGENQILVTGKGGKHRMAYLAPAAHQAIKEYLQLRGDDHNPWLFISFSKNRPKNPTKIGHLSPRMVQLMLQNYAQRLGIYKKITPHTLRHSFATKVLLEGGDLRSVQQMLGHANLSTTQIYTHVTDWQIRDLHGKVFGNNVT